MFLMKLNLEECRLWWEAAMICEVCVVEGQRGDFSPWCAVMMLPTSFTYSSSKVPSLLSFLHLQLFGPAQAMWFKCKPLVCAWAVRAVFFALGSYDVYGQTSARFPGVQPKPSPHSVTSDTVGPGPVWADAGWGNAEPGEVSSEQTIVPLFPIPSFLVFHFGNGVRCHFGLHKVKRCGDKVALLSAWRNPELPPSPRC